jgi:hypothetical protein
VIHRARTAVASAVAAAVVAAAVVATPACAAFSDATEAPPGVDEAGGGGDGGGGGDSGGVNDAASADATADATCNAISLADLVKENESTTLVDGKLGAVATGAAGSQSNAKRTFDLESPVSVTLDYDVTFAGGGSYYAEPACSVLLYYEASDVGATQIDYELGQSGGLVFRIGDPSTSLQRYLWDLDPITNGALPTTKVHLDFTIEDGPPRLSGKQQFGDKSSAFAVSLDRPVTNLTLFCGIYYVSFATDGTFSVQTSNFAGTVCKR